MIKREQNARGSGDQLREQLVDAASQLLIEPQGLAAPSLRAVARAVGVSPAAVYLHFPSQQALILAVIERQYDGLRAAWAETRDATAPARDRLTSAGLAYVHWALAHPGAYQLLFESADELGLDTPEALVLVGGPGWDLIEGLAGEIASGYGLALDEATTVATRLWVSLHGLVSLRLHKAAHAWPTSVETEVVALLALVPSPSPRNLP